MRVVLDTNVLISGIFFGGAPSRVLVAWRQGRFLRPARCPPYTRSGVDYLFATNESTRTAYNFVNGVLTQTISLN